MTRAWMPCDRNHVGNHMHTARCDHHHRAMAAQKNLKDFSHFLVYLCRRGASDWGLNADVDGWLPLDAVKGLRPARRFTTEDVHEVVGELAGGRLQLSEDGTQLRAVQGHSIQIRDDGYQRVLPQGDEIPDYLVHGTDEASWLRISREGLRPMGRQHVHLAQDLDRVRSNSTVHVYVDKAKVLDHGLELLIAANGVILCRSTIPPDCFHRAWHVTQEQELLHKEDHQWVDDTRVQSNTRWKQIRLGRWTYEYAVWIFSTEEERDQYPIPEPPDCNDPNLPKRRFLDELSAWRRGLHRYQAWYEAKHRQSGVETPALKRPRGSMAQDVPFFGASGTSKP